MKRSAPHHPKMRLLAATLKIPVAHAVGIMEMLWHYSAHVSPRGDIGTVTDGEIAGAVAWDRKPSQLLDALVLSGWLERDEIYRFIIHDWPDHCEASVSKILERRGHDFLSSYGVSVYSEKKVGRRKLQKELVINGPTRVAEAKAMAKASVELNTSSEENTSTRAGSENSEAPAEAAEVRCEWEKRFPRVKPAERGMIATRVEEIIMPLDEWRDRMDAYKQSMWAKEQGYPLRGFLKDPRSWEAPQRSEVGEGIPDASWSAPRAPKRYENRFVKSLGLPETALAPIIPDEPDTVDAWLGWCGDRQYAALGALWFATGAELSVKMLREGRWLWGTYTQERRDRIMAHAERKFPKTKPEYMKGSIVRYFETEPWGSSRIERVLPAVKDAKEKPSQEEYEAKILKGMQELEARERASNGIR